MQGMAFIVGPLLLNMPDEEAFSTLARLMKSVRQQVVRGAGRRLLTLGFPLLCGSMASEATSHRICQVCSCASSNSIVS